jgi:hypothetical protein
MERPKGQGIIARMKRKLKKRIARHIHRVQMRPPTQRMHMQPVNHNERCAYRTRLDDEDTFTEEDRQVEDVNGQQWGGIPRQITNRLTGQHLDLLADSASSLNGNETSSYSSTDDSSWAELCHSDLDEDSIFGSNILATDSDLDDDSTFGSYILATDSGIVAFSNSSDDLEGWSGHFERTAGQGSTSRQTSCEAEDGSSDRTRDMPAESVLLRNTGYLQPRDTSQDPGKSFRVLPPLHTEEDEPDKYEGTILDDLVDSWHEVDVAGPKWSYTSDWLMTSSQIPALETIVQSVASSAWKAMCDIGESFPCIRPTDGDE